MTPTISSPPGAPPLPAVAPLAAAAGIAAQWLLYRAAPTFPFPPFSIGNWIIRKAPGPVATAAIDRLGHAARPGLAISVVVVLVAAAVPLRRRPLLVAVALGSLSLAATAVDPVASTTTAALLASGLGASVAAGVAYAATPRPRPTTAAGLDRRRFLAGASVMVILASVGAGALWRTRRRVLSQRVTIRHPAELTSDAAADAVTGLSPLVTAAADHYTVDINLAPPQLDPSEWKLRISGEVDHPAEYRYDELLQRPLVERLAVLSCISNPVGGPLVGNARWAGVPVADLLDAAGTRAGAMLVEARGADGYREVIPLADITRPEVLVALAMDGERLPTGHGFPARLRIPSRYGVKNVKWLTDLVVTRAAVGYWTRRGWDPDAVVHTESRIDTPTHRASVPRKVVVAGVAWAGDRGVQHVEVSVDDGETWQTAALEAPGDPLSWRRWWTTVHLPTGNHTITVRAIDGTGATQPTERAPAHPAGATGWHPIAVRVEG